MPEVITSIGEILIDFLPIIENGATVFIFRMLRRRKRQKDARQPVTGRPAAAGRCRFNRRAGTEPLPNRRLHPRPPEKVRNRRRLPSARFAARRRRPAQAQHQPRGQQRRQYAQAERGESQPTRLSQ